MADISIIIPNLNGAKFLPDCLDTLLKSINNCPEYKFEIILVDNASTDDSIAIFNKYFLDSKILLLDKNYGFAGAVNRGIEAATSDWVLLCNNDLKIASNWMKLITSALSLQSSNALLAAITGTVLSFDGKTYESKGLKFFINGRCENIYNKRKFVIRNLKLLIPHFIWGASAALTLYNKNILNKVGGFDSDFFAYEEDVDLALRLHNLGFLTLYVPPALCYHLGGATSGRMGNFRHIMDAKNWIYIIIKNYSLKDIFLNIIPLKIERLRNLSGLLKNTPKKLWLKSVYKTYWPVVKNFSKMLKKRKQINALISPASPPLQKNPSA